MRLITQYFVLILLGKKIQKTSKISFVYFGRLIKVN